MKKFIVRGLKPSSLFGDDPLETNVFKPTQDTVETDMSAFEVEESYRAIGWVQPIATETGGNHAG